MVEKNHKFFMMLLELPFVIFYCFRGAEMKANRGDVCELVGLPLGATNVYHWQKL